MLSSFSVRRPYTVIVGVLLVLILGGASVYKMQTSLIPELDLPYVAVITTNPGASPEEVEKELTSPIEAALATTSGVDTIASVSNENMSIVFMQFIEDTNMDAAMLSMRETLDLYADYLPQDASTPMLARIDANSLPVAVITADIDGASAAEISAFVDDNVVPAFESIDGVASVSTMGLVQQEVQVVINQEKLDALNAKLARLENFTLLASGDTASLSDEQMVALMSGDMSVLESLAGAKTADDENVVTKEMIAQILQAMNMGYPNGYIEEEGVDYLIRTGDGYEDVDAIGEQLLISVPEANLEVRVKDVANVEVIDNADDTYTKVNGNDAIVLMLMKQSESSTAEVSDLIAEKTNELEAENNGLRIVALMDQGTYVDMVVGSVTSNLIYGAILAVIVLLLFLRSWRLTGVIAMSIPLSLVVALILMYFSGITINLLSLSGLALGVGMLVDNSIVVIENIYRKRSEGLDTKQAAIDGAKQVAAAITSSTLTTCAVFAPFAFATGITQQLFVDLALTICFSLLGSLIVALTFVPMVCSGALRHTQEKTHTTFEKFQDWYARILEAALNHKAIVLLSVAALFVGSIIYLTQMGTEFFPETNSTQISSTISLSEDATFDERVDELEEIVALIKDVEGVDTIGVTMSDSASSTGSLDYTSLMGGSGVNVTAYIVLDEDRSGKSQDISRAIDAKTAAAGYETQTAASSMDISMLTGSGVEVAIYGDDLDELREVATDFADELSSLEGTTEISNGYNKPSEEIRVTVDKDAAITNGLTVYQVYNEVSKLVASAKAATTIDSNTGNLDVIVSQDSDEAPTLEDLYALTIHSSSMDEDIALEDIATIEQAQGYTSIAHDKQTRVVTVTAQIADGYNVGKVGATVDKLVAEYQVPDGIKLVVGGENTVINDALEDLALVIALAIALVYLIMVAQFQSFKYPFIIMFTLPLCYTGGILLLALFGMPLSIVAVVGFVMLTGIVVNNGIVFVDYVNQMREAGMSRREALIVTGRHRIRPIIMTALTTVIGMMTMALGVGQSAEMSQPMAIVMIGGLSYATVLTTVIVPIIYELFSGKEKSKEEPSLSADAPLPASARYDEC